MGLFSGKSITRKLKRHFGVSPKKMFFRNFAASIGFGPAQQYYVDRWQREQGVEEGEWLSPDFKKAKGELTGDTDKDRRHALAKYGLHAAPWALAFEVEAAKKEGERKNKEKVERRTKKPPRRNPGNAVREARKQQRRRALGATGRSDTILTGALGVTDGSDSEGRKLGGY